MYNRDEFLAQKGAEASTRVEMGRIAAMIDVKGKERFGLGEGIVYRGNNYVTKAITKPINDPSQAGGVSSFSF